MSPEAHITLLAMSLLWLSYSVHQAQQELQCLRYTIASYHQKNNS
jgi:cell division protein FtsL